MSDEKLIERASEKKRHLEILIKLLTKCRHAKRKGGVKHHSDKMHM
jgi:hypothetical protein